MTTKKRRASELYEDYWMLTVGHTDYFSKGTVSYQILEHLVSFVENNNNVLIKGDPRYEILQNEILELSPKKAELLKNKLPSIRKEINQFVKIGFIEPGLKNQHHLTKEFLTAQTQLRKQRIFSEILVDNAKFKCSVTNSDNQTNHMKFFLRTLEEVLKINLREDIQGLMMCNTNKIEKGYLDKDELKHYVNLAKDIKFEERKYNQTAYFKNFLKKMIDLRVVDDDVYFKTDADDIFGKLDPEREKRDNYKQRLWRDDLREEAGNKCMVDRVTTRGIGSHIKSWRDCRDDGNINEAWNQNNGLYLNRNLDDLFDNGIVSFDSLGKILINKNTSKISLDQINEISKLKISDEFLNSERKKYLEHHRNKWNFSS